LPIDIAVKLHYYIGMKELDFYEEMLNTLPKALTDEERQMYMELYYKNPNRKSKEAQNARAKLIEGNMRLVVSTINRFFQFEGLQKEEVFSCGIQWMINAIDNFDIEKDLALSTYLVTTIKHGIYRERTCTRRHTIDTMSLDTTVRNDEYEDVINLEEIIPDSDNFVEQVNRKLSNEDFMRKVEGALRQKYSEEHIDMLYRRMGINGYRKQTLESIGERYHVTRERVRQIVEKQLKTIKHDVLGYKRAPGRRERKASKVDHTL